MTVQDLTLVAAADAAALPAEPFAARHLIDGVWRDSADGATFDRVSPAHGVARDPRREGRRGGDRGGHRGGAGGLRRRALVGAVAARSARRCCSGSPT